MAPFAANMTKVQHALGVAKVDVAYGRICVAVAGSRFVLQLLFSPHC